MPTLTPVDNDPFAAPSSAGSPKLTPVDHDPFATTGSGTTGQSAQPGWTDYLLQHLAGPLWDPNAKKTLGTTALWDKPADVSWGDYMAAHAQPLDDTVRSAANAFGGDRFAAMMDRLTGTGPKISELVTQSATGQPTDMLSIERARSAAAAQRDPSATAAGDVLGGAMIGGPLGEAAQGLRAAPYISKLPGWLASRVAGGTVGAGSSAAAAYGRGDDITMPTIIGGVLGTVIGAPSGGGNKLPTSPSAQSYFDQATQEYKPLSNLLYDGKSEVHPTLNITDAKNAQRDWSGKRWDDASKTSDEIEALLDKPQLSANDIQQSQNYLRDKVINNPAADPNDKAYAGYYIKKLQGVLENGTPQTGVPQNLPPGVTPSNYAAYVKSKGDFFTGQGKDMQRADVWKTVGATTAGRDIGTQAGSWSADQAERAAAGKSGVFAPPGSPYFNATEALAKTTGKPTALDWSAKHFILGPLAFTATGEAANAASGGDATGHQPWYARLGEELGAGLLYGGGKAGYSAYTAAANRAEQQAAEAALRQTIASRTMQNPAGTYSQLSQGSSPFLDEIRRLIYGRTGSMSH